ncbi:MAG: ATP-binding protein [Hyphomicrobiales bacterium]|nr:ATP-binding protein [Hyphomicrobiales bacterium]
METRTVELTLRNAPTEVSQLRDAIDRCAAELSVPARAVFQLQVAIDELVSNVIGHAWPGGGSHQFLVRVIVSSQGARVEVIDDGIAFDSGTAADAAHPSADRHQIGGRGLGLLAQLVDRIEYARIDNRNHTTVHKHW